MKYNQSKEIEDIEFCPECGKALKDEHICQGCESEDNHWK